jgi:transposase
MTERAYKLGGLGGERVNSSIGIDPDSTGFVCALVKDSNAQVITKRFSVSQNGLSEFLRWVKAEGKPIVGVEGTHGQSRPVEKVLREAGVIFHSFKPADTDKFRKAVLGQNKNNERDAESVARYALALEAQGKLEQYRRVWSADMELQLLSRRYESLSDQLTGEVNRLWKLLRYASPDLYLLLGGKNGEIEQREKVLKNQGILSLLMSKPDIGEWKRLSESGMLEAMGGGRYKGRRELIEELRKVAGSFPALSPGMALMIRGSAHQIERFKREQIELTRMLDTLTQGNAQVQCLKSRRGIATLTATKMIAEIIDIRRFAREDSLACYSGLGMREHTTGNTTLMIPTRLFNHRLKDAFMTAARNVVFYDPDSHLAGYYRNLVKAGMQPLEATKRVARGLVRVIFRELSALNESKAIDVEQERRKEGEGDMASGVTRSDQGRKSNISPSSQRSNKSKSTKKVKSRKIPGVITNGRRKNQTVTKIIA